MVRNERGLDRSAIQIAALRSLWEFTIEKVEWPGNKIAVGACTLFDKPHSEISMGKKSFVSQKSRAGNKAAQKDSV